MLNFAFYIGSTPTFYIAINILYIYFSAIAVNLKACNHFRLYNGKAAEVRRYAFWCSVQITVRLRE